MAEIGANIDKACPEKGSDGMCWELKRPRFCEIMYVQCTHHCVFNTHANKLQWDNGVLLKDPVYQSIHCVTRSLAAIQII